MNKQNQRVFRWGGEGGLHRQEEAINQRPWGGFCLFTYQETHLFPVVLNNLIVWQARPSLHVEVTRSFLGVESDLSALAFSKSTHKQRTALLNKSTGTLWAKGRVRPLDSDNTWIKTAGLMRSDVASGF